MNNANTTPATNLDPWIVDEVTTPNGVSYEINRLWEGDDGETHTDTIAEVCTEYRGDIPKQHAALLASAPSLLKSLVRMLALHRANMNSGRANALRSVHMDCPCGACVEAREAVASAIGCDASEVMDCIDVDGKLADVAIAH